MMPSHLSLDVVLTIFKFLGIIVSGAGAIVGTSPDKPSKKQPKTPPKSKLLRVSKRFLSKQYALRWAILGLTVSLLSQFIETIKATKETQQTRKKDSDAALATSNQLRLAQQSLDSIQSLLTTFETISVDVTVSFPPFTPGLSNAASELSALWTRLPDRQGGTSSVSVTIAVTPKDQHIPVSVWESSDGASSVEFLREAECVRIPIGANLTTNVLSRVPSIAQLTNIVAYLLNPSMRLEFLKPYPDEYFKTPGHLDPQEADLVLNVHSVSGCELLYNTDSTNFVFTFTVPEQKRATIAVTHRIRSILDLRGAHVTSNFSPRIDPEVEMLCARAHLEALHLEVDGRPITITQLSTEPMVTGTNLLFGFVPPAVFRGRLPQSIVP